MTSNDGVILYGPPASGKDTVTRELHRLDARCELFPRLKVGNGRTTGYRLITENELERLTNSGDIAWINHRYNATYAVDVSGLENHLRHHVSVLHLGQGEAIDAVRAATSSTHWTIIELWCPRETAKQRLIRRDPTTVNDRLTAWDATERLPGADQRIDTSRISAGHAAQVIVQSLKTHHSE